MVIHYKIIKHNALLILGLIFVLIGCKSNNSYSEPHSTIANNSITFIAGECFGACPAYKFVLPIKGNAIFIGKKNVKIIGHSTAAISQKKVNEIYDKFFELDFKTKTYNPNLRDLPQKKLIYCNDTISIKGTKNIPKELIFLIKEIENTVNKYVFNK
ncbi:MULTISPECIES: DUF6438 domain-containing protein [Aquimarina]|uniref:DUF6438 domain-containing protein n=1 Tax=Aquimarina TaxID=290174 RepID=UPI00094506C8|nr:MULTISPECIES: DUF6438 domain-containing protein [Aquimarina]